MECSNVFQIILKQAAIIFAYNRNRLMSLIGGQTVLYQEINIYKKIVIWFGVPGMPCHDSFRRHSFLSKPVIMKFIVSKVTLDVFYFSEHFYFLLSLLFHQSNILTAYSFQKNRLAKKGVFGNTQKNYFCIVF
jgi:hypothetical protein